MKEMFEKLQTLGRKAAQLKQAVESAPARVADLRQTLALTAGQLQQLRQDVQINVAGLRAEDGSRLTALLAEILVGAGPIREAGYDIAGVEMEVDPVQRVFVLLDKVGDVPAIRLQSLLAAQATRPGLHGLLASLIKAEELADTLALPGLNYARLRVEIGPVPAIRLCWQSEMASALAPPVITPERPEASPVPLASHFGAGSFFERPAAVSGTAPPIPIVTSLPPEVSVPPAPSVVPTVTVAAPLSVPSPEAPPEAVGDESGGGDWRRGALDRFKRMPDLRKR